MEGIFKIPQGSKSVQVSLIQFISVDSVQFSKVPDSVQFRSSDLKISSVQSMKPSSGTGVFSKRQFSRKVRDGPAIQDVHSSIYHDPRTSLKKITTKRMKN